MIKSVDRVWGGLLWVLMALAALYVGAIMIFIVYVTVFRTVGWAYPPHLFTFIEYSFIYILFLGSPWLIRTRGHVYIEILTAAVSETVRKRLSRMIAFACALVCLIWAYYGAQLFIQDIVNNQFDELRDHDIKREIVTISFPVGFFLMSVEFFRFVFLKEPMHEGHAGVASERIELEETKRNIEEARNR